MSIYVIFAYVLGSIVNEKPVNLLRDSDRWQINVYFLLIFQNHD